LPLGTGVLENKIFILKRKKKNLVRLAF
jgi:hypothetical protein